MPADYGPTEMSYPSDLIPGGRLRKEVLMLDMAILPGIISALRSAERLTAAGMHEAAADDAKRAHELLTVELKRAGIGMTEAAIRETNARLDPRDVAVADAISGVLGMVER